MRHCGGGARQGEGGGGGPPRGGGGGGPSPLAPHPRTPDSAHPSPPPPSLGAPLTPSPLPRRAQLLFAPRNSDVSSRANNTDAWGWEQLLWFGMGQRLRTGLWAPGEPLPPSLLEMLAHFRLRGVRPVAYVYPILGFLAGTLPGGASPPWIVNGTYFAAATSTATPASPAAAPRAAAAPRRSGPLRSDLA